MSRLRDFYEAQIVPEMTKKFSYTNKLAVPKLEKIIINMGVGEAVQNAKILDGAVEELTKIAGQKPVVTRAKKSIATFKVRQGQGIGCKVTLRNEKMWAFIETLFFVALPRVRDFRGISNKSFDSKGNYTLGVKEQIIFPQIIYDNVKKVRGFDITFVISSNDIEMSRHLLKSLGAPFQRIREVK